VSSVCRFGGSEKYKKSTFDQVYLMFSFFRSHHSVFNLETRTASSPYHPLVIPSHSKPIFAHYTPTHTHTRYIYCQSLIHSQQCLGHTTPCPTPCQWQFLPRATNTLPTASIRYPHPSAMTPSALCPEGHPMATLAHLQATLVAPATSTKVLARPVA
jgi:hypothetical protein